MKSQIDYIFLSSNWQASEASTYRSLWAYRSSFHAELRARANYWGRTPYRANKLIKNIAILPPVFFAYNTLIVEETVANELVRFGGVDVVPVGWRDVYEFPIDEASIRQLHQENPWDGDVGLWVDQQLVSPPLWLKDLRYYEVVVPRSRDVVTASSQSISVEAPHPHSRSQKINAELTPELPRCYPMLEVDWSVYACERQLFQCLRPHTSDRELFLVTDTSED